MLGKLNFCFNFKRNHEYIDLVHEINILLKDQTTHQLKEFLEEHQKQRVNIVIDELDFLTDEIIDDIKQVIDDTVPKFDRTHIKLNWDIKEEFDGNIRNKLQEAGILYYYATVASNWDDFNELIQARVSDIYVGNILGFDIERVAAAAHRNDILVRVFPNVAQSTWQAAPAYTKFFIRPEDCYLYSKFVDTFEFFEIDGHPLTNTEQLYDIYKLRMNWYGDLRMIIMGLDKPLDNRLLDEHWAYSRMHCQKICIINERCKICDRFVEMSEKMSEKEKALNQILKK